MLFLKRSFNNSWLWESCCKPCFQCSQNGFVVAPDLDLVESTGAEQRNDLIKSNRDVILA